MTTEKFLIAVRCLTRLRAALQALLPQKACRVTTQWRVHRRRGSAAGSCLLTPGTPSCCCLSMLWLCRVSPLLLLLLLLPLAHASVAVSVTTAVAAVAVVVDAAVAYCNAGASAATSAVASWAHHLVSCFTRRACLLLVAICCLCTTLLKIHSCCLL